MWNCPTCKRTFKSKNQYHSCFVSDKAYHLKRMNEKIQLIFEALLTHLDTYESISIIYLKTCVKINTHATFLSVYTKQNSLELEFQLDRKEDIFPISFCQRISKNRVLHRVVLGELSEFDDQIRAWVNDAYCLIEKKTTDN